MHRLYTCVTDEILCLLSCQVVLVSVFSSYIVLQAWLAIACMCQHFKVECVCLCWRMAGNHSSCLLPITFSNTMCIA